MPDKEKIDILLKTIDRFWSQAIQTENQRANFTNYMLVVIGATQGYIINREFDRFSLLLSYTIIILGLYGSIVIRKYYERFRDCASKVGRIIDELKITDPFVDLELIENKAKIKHNKKFYLFSKIRLNWLWLILYFLFVALGIVDLIIIYGDYYNCLRY